MLPNIVAMVSILCATVHPNEFGRRNIKHALLPHEFERTARLARSESFDPLVANSFRAHFAIAVQRRRHSCHGGSFDFDPQRRGESRGPQYAQPILRESFVSIPHRPKTVVGQVGYAVEWIDKCSFNGIVRDRVDGKVTPSEILSDVHYENHRIGTSTVAVATFPS